jgi:hypothetical protein
VGIFAQDPAAWVEDGTLDYVIPMAYTPDPTEFTSMTQGYREALAGDRLVMGINLDELAGAPVSAALQVRRALEAGTRGHVFFSLAGLEGLVGEVTGGGMRTGSDLYAALEERLGVPFTVRVRTRPRAGSPAEGASSDRELLTRVSEAVAAALGRMVLILP